MIAQPRRPSCRAARCSAWTKARVVAGSSEDPLVLHPTGTTGIPLLRVVHSTPVAQPTTERRWRTFADVVAFTLGTNVWISIVTLPAAFVGALHGKGHIIAAIVPFVVLLLGLQRRSEAILLGLFPAAVLVPV